MRSLVRPRSSARRHQDRLAVRGDTPCSQCRRRPAGIAPGISAPRGLGRSGTSHQPGSDAGVNWRRRAHRNRSSSQEIQSTRWTSCLRAIRPARSNVATNFAVSWALLDRLVAQDHGRRMRLATSSEGVEVEQARLESCVDGVRATGVRQRQEATVVGRERDHELARPEGPLVEGDAEDLIGERVVVELRIGCQGIDGDQVCGVHPPGPRPRVSSHPGRLGRRVVTPGELSPGQASGPRPSRSPSLRHPRRRRRNLACWQWRCCRSRPRWWRSCSRRGRAPCCVPRRSRWRSC